MIMGQSKGVAKKLWILTLIVILVILALVYLVAITPEIELDLYFVSEVRAGETFDLYIGIWNNGPSYARGVFISIVMPEGFSFAWLPRGWESMGTNRLDSYLGNFHPGHHIGRVFNVTVSEDLSGTYEIAMNVTGHNFPPQILAREISVLLPD